MLSTESQAQKSRCKKNICAFWFLIDESQWTCPCFCPLLFLRKHKWYPGHSCWHSGETIFSWQVKSSADEVIVMSLKLADWAAVVASLGQCTTVPDLFWPTSWSVIIHQMWQTQEDMKKPWDFKSTVEDTLSDVVCKLDLMPTAFDGKRVDPGKLVERRKWTC